MCMCAKSLQSCPALCSAMNYSPLDFSVHGILQARILEWVAMPSSRGSFQPRNRTGVSCIAGGFFTSWATREAPCYTSTVQKSTQQRNQLQRLHARDKVHQTRELTWLDTETRVHIFERSQLEESYKGNFLYLIPKDRPWVWTSCG